MPNYFVTAARIQREFGRISEEFYRKLRDAEDKHLEPPDDEEEVEDEGPSCRCGERCRC